MPTIRIEGYKFRFYSSDRGEPPHVHVIKGEDVAKIWLQPIGLESNHGYHRAEINRILRLTAEYHDALSEAWHEYFEKYTHDICDCQGRSISWQSVAHSAE